ncbi:asparagine synthetase B family protein [Nocardiopsis baichengensis]|uniref:hypothetical protein n=1 Tax=Nocardiopsis baichengensis TaxID=280240 RepID=UPI0003478D63|nr:hypothetical protein [Nocardiopsis baichengensis]
MFRFRLARPFTAEDLPGLRAAAPGGPFLEVYAHPALEQTVVHRPDGGGFIVNRERLRGCPAPPPEQAVGERAYDRALADALAWPLGFVLIEFGPARVRLHASQWGTAPLHLAAAGGALHGSWDLLDVAPHVDAARLDPQEVTGFLTYRGLYSRRTVLADVCTLTERATAEFDGARLSMAYPGPGLHAQPRELRPHADVVGAFERVLAGAVEQWDYAPERAVADLSGGMDSANVALTLARLHPGRVATGAMMFHGPVGAQQARRRAELRTAGFAEDHTLDLAGHLPFAPGGPRDRGEPFDPEEGPYCEARNTLLDAYAAADKQVVFTGLGGDEAMKLRSRERQALGLAPAAVPLEIGADDLPAYLGARAREAIEAGPPQAAPIGPTLWSILDSFAALYPHYMRRGLWPVNPLAAPGFVRLAESLPADWRADKHLLRSRLRAAGFSRDVAHPELAENFQHILNMAMVRHGVDRLNALLDEGAVLVEEGFLDEAELRRAARRFTETGDHRLYEVYRPLMLETAVRSLRRLSSPAGRAAARPGG